jgi:hypothetical protein
MPVAVRSKARVCGCSLAGYRVQILPAHGCLSLVSVVCCQVEVSATGRSLVQKSPTERGLSECDREASIMRKFWPARGYCATGEKYGEDCQVCVYESMFPNRLCCLKTPVSYVLSQ